MGRLAEAAAHAGRGMAEVQALGVWLAEAFVLVILGEINYVQGGVAGGHFAGIGMPEAEEAATLLAGTAC